MVLERTTASRHDTQVRRPGSIVVLLISLELAHELYARIYPVCLELEEVQTSTDRIVARLAREVYQFG